MSRRRTVSRRRLLVHGAAAAAGAAALAAQSASAFGQAPAVVTARRFRAWVTRGGGADRTTLQELTLRPIAGRQIVVRTEATNLCYSNVPCVACASAARRLPDQRADARAAAGWARLCPAARQSSRATAASASSKRSARRYGGCRWAIESASRVRRSAATATSVCAAAPTCASSFPTPTWRPLPR